MSMQDKNKEIERIMASLDGTSPAEANPFLYEKIRNRMAIQSPRGMYVRWAVAACLLLAINVVTWIEFDKKDSSTRVNPIAAELGFTNNGYQY